MQLESIQNQEEGIQNKLGTEDYIVQQDNASAYSIRVAEQWFQNNRITSLPWPVLSPDLGVVPKN